MMFAQHEQLLNDIIKKCIDLQKLPNTPLLKEFIGINIVNNIVTIYTKELKSKNWGNEYLIESKENFSLVELDNSIEWFTLLFKQRHEKELFEQEQDNARKELERKQFAEAKEYEEFIKLKEKLEPLFLKHKHLLEINED